MRARFTTIPKLNLLLGSVGSCLLLLWLLDRFVLVRYAGLIYVPDSVAEYRTGEFKCTAEINGLGFRGREAGAAPGALRIAALGDSFTYGWGVDLEETWPSRLEKLLAQAGRPAVTCNLGIAGGNPRDYADLAERAFPLLHPELVIVAVLQGDDLEQLIHMPSPAPRRWLENLRRVLGRLLRRRVVVSDEWARQASRLRAGLGAEGARRFAALSPEVQAAFLAGQLNPHLVYNALERPDYFQEPCALESEPVRRAVGALTRELARIKAAAQKVKARVIVVSVPYCAYTSRGGLESRRALGYRLEEELLTSDAADRGIRTAAEGAGLEFHSVTEAFRARGDDAGLFYPLDGHFTPRGNRLFAELIEPLARRGW